MAQSREPQIFHGHLKFDAILTVPTRAGSIPMPMPRARVLSMDHRVTQGINHSSDRGNLHNTDVTINGKPYTGAVDISVRCLTEPQIRTLLAGSRQGTDLPHGSENPGRTTGRARHTFMPFGWPARLKRVLRQQVESWLRGANGLGTDQPYAFWKPSAEMSRTVAMLYRASNGTALRNSTMEARERRKNFMGGGTTGLGPVLILAQLSKLDRR